MSKDPKRVKAGKRAKRKGNKFERQVAKRLEKWWGHGQFRKTPKSGGWSDQAAREGFRATGDVITTAQDFLFIVECKDEEGWHLEQFFTSTQGKLNDWLAQAVDQCPDYLYPVLVAKRNYQKPLIFFDKKAVTAEPWEEYPYSEIRGFAFHEKHYKNIFILMSFENFLKMEPEDFGKHGEQNSE